MIDSRNPNHLDRPSHRRRTLAPAILVFVLAAPLVGQHHDGHDARALAADPAAADGPIAPLFEGMGDHHRPITTASELAQLFFDQGLKLTYGFNHQEALRSFKEATRLDPECAMCYWGWALVLGPNLNLPMDPEVVSQAYRASRQAVARRAAVTEGERLLIDALAARYSDDPDGDRAPLDAAYAEAMGVAYQRLQDDADAATLYAAALMNLSPWSYWTGDGRPLAGTDDILGALERALAVDPEHEGALHYFIHALESVDPARAEPAADTLRGLAPSAGHLVHMPSHIYMRVGRYQDAFDANAEASRADESYIVQCLSQGIYPLTYYPHNVHFQAWAAFMQGRREDALRLARKVAAQVPADHHGNVWGLYQTFLGMPLFAMVRFGAWDEVLREPQPPAHLAYWNGVWHYARGLAHVHGGRPGKARKHLRAIERLAAEPRTGEEIIGFSDGATLLEIAQAVLAGERAAARGRYDRALGHLERAVRIEDGLLYNEPPDWYYPVRHTLGAVLLEAGFPGQAETVYWRDLEDNRDNGFALFGLEKSLRAQGKAAQADGVAARLAAAWSAAETALRSSRF